jgi:hypothetical protein
LFKRYRSVETGEVFLIAAAGRFCAGMWWPQVWRCRVNGRRDCRPGIEAAIAEAEGRSDDSR